MSSVDYDPIKAHEYYMKHRHLKGRHSTKGMSESQKETWAYAKSQVSENYKNTKAQITENKKAANADVNKNMKSEKERYSKETNKRIETLRSQLKAMPKEKRKEMKEKISGVISDLKARLKERKQAVTDLGKVAKENIKNTTADARAAAKADYEKNLDEAYNRVKGSK